MRPLPDGDVAYCREPSLTGTLGEAKAPLCPLALKVRRHPLLAPRVGMGATVVPSGGTAVSLGATRDGVAGEASVHLGGSSTIEADPLPMDPLAQSEGGRLLIHSHASPLHATSCEAARAEQLS